ncbi:MAG: hypothetical protein K2K85_01745 [Clostridia bacterium]|nr:hypothetical protein [Clostridia bacterium]
MQSKILQLYRDIVGNQVVIDKKFYKKELDEVLKWQDLMLKRVEGDDKFKAIFFQYDLATAGYESIINEQYFKQGFLYGAKLALEICGYELKDKQ